MTMQELNFSLLVEQMLSKIVDPAYRQIMVEAFMVVSTILRRNPELVFHQSVNMDKVTITSSVFVLMTRKLTGVSSKSKNVRVVSL